MAEKTTTKKNTGKDPEEPKGEGLVAIPQKQLDELMQGLADLRKDRDMLLQVADKKQLATYYQRHQEKIPSKVMLRTFVDPNDGKTKVVLGWRSVKDIMESESMPGGATRWTEDQRCELLFEDGKSSGEIMQRKFNRDYKQVEAEVRSRVVDEVTGNVALKVVRLDTGKEYTIGVTFIN